jgi:hypothetical protein
MPKPSASVVLAVAVGFCAGLIAYHGFTVLGRPARSSSPAQEKGAMTIILRTDTSLPSLSARCVAADDTYIFTFRERDETAQAGGEAYRSALAHVKGD